MGRVDVEYEGTLAGFAVALDAEPGTDPGAVPTQVEPYWDATLADGVSDGSGTDEVAPPTP